MLSFTDVDQFATSAGFRQDWWDDFMGRRSERWLACHQSGREIARLRLAEHAEVGLRTYLDHVPAGGFVQIKFIEVRATTRGHRAGRLICADLASLYPEREFCAFSEADGFWRHIGWHENQHRESTPETAHGYQTLFTSSRLQ